MDEQTEVKPLTLDTLHAGAQVVIAPARNSGDYEGAIVLSVTDRMIVTTAGKFVRRSGVEWGAVDSYHYRAIAHDYRAGYGALMTWEKAKAINADNRAERERKALAIRVRDDADLRRLDLSLDKLQRIAAILDEGKEAA